MYKLQSSIKVKAWIIPPTQILYLNLSDKENIFSNKFCYQAKNYNAKIKKIIKILAFTLIIF